MTWQHKQDRAVHRYLRQGRAGHFGTQWSKIRRGCVPTARGCVAKWDAVSMLKYALCDPA